MAEFGKKFRFREFPMYREARMLGRDLKRFSKLKFPTEERYGLLLQLWRALDSIILNIAEGCDRGTDRDFAHFLNQAHTSLNEVVACLDIAHDNSYITGAEESPFLDRLAALADQITAFRKTLLATPTK
ncbi:MAG: four helix bundle protein [Candidatus Uhrbacteria bacterium]